MFTSGMVDAVPGMGRGARALWLIAVSIPQREFLDTDLLREVVAHLDPSPATRSLTVLQDTTRVDVIADKLDLSPYCSALARKQSRKPVYNLSAVTNHSGSMAGGHYTAQCRSVLDDDWYDCNDSSVRPDKYVEGPSSSAYVLFYRQQE